MRHLSLLLACLLLAACILPASGTADAAGTIYCPNCGRAISSESRFCMYCGYQIPSSPYPSASVSKGDVVRFGHYEQDNNFYNGAEAIEWLVLDVDADGSALLLSSRILDAVAYNTVYTDMSWEYCSLRSWLNYDFYYAAFDTAERAQIVSATIYNSRNDVYNVSGGRDTTDKIYLLSIGNLQYYLPSAYSRQTYATRYCQAKLESMPGYDGVWWWLRTPGSNTYRAAGVYVDVQPNGTIDYEGARVDHSYNGVRPAMWVKAAALEKVA